VRSLLLSIATGCAVIILAVVISYKTSLRSDYYQPRQPQRSKAGAEWEKGVHVAVVWPRFYETSSPDDAPSSAQDTTCKPEIALPTRGGKPLVPSFPEGMQVALDELKEGMIALTRKVNFKVDASFYEETDDTGGMPGVRIAERVIRDASIVAALGHYDSANAILASLFYEDHGVLFVTPRSTDPKLTSHGFRYTFRFTPTDGEIAAKMVAFARLHNRRRVGIYFARTPGGESLEPLIEGQAENQGLKVVFAQSYLPVSNDWIHQQDFRPMIARHTGDDADVILIADDLPRAAKLILDLRDMSQSQPIIGSDKLDDTRLWRYAGPGALPLYVVSTNDPDATTPQYTSFTQRYYKKYCKYPSYNAGQGYETGRLLIDAVDRSGSAAPLVLASTLRTVENFSGLFERVTFTESGDMSGRRIIIKSLSMDGSFHSKFCFAGETCLPAAGVTASP
jgi:branched-chain amino acid transport system substrate-binding protein